jgi:hypothetical protein
MRLLAIRNTIIAFLVAAAFFNFAVTYRHWIILAGVVALLWFGMRWLTRHHPLIAVAVIAFARGLLSRR